MSHPSNRHSRIPARSWSLRLAGKRRTDADTAHEARSLRHSREWRQIKLSCARSDSEFHDRDRLWVGNPQHIADHPHIGSSVWLAQSPVSLAVSNKPTTIVFDEEPCER